jgi:hypothetical protein
MTRVPPTGLYECPCGESHVLDAVLGEFIADLGPDRLTETVQGTYLVPRVYIFAHGIKGKNVARLASVYGWEQA